MSYFPLFIQIQDCPCLVVGGGTVALRKVSVLTTFGADVHVVADEIDASITAMPGVICREKRYETEDLTGMRLAVAATSDTALNHRIAMDCRKRGIVVNAVDQPQDCDFIFPAFQKQGEVVAAFCSGGQSPLISQYLKKESEDLLTPEFGELAECMGQWRPVVREKISSEKQRKQFWKEIFSLGLERGEPPKEDEIREILYRYCKSEIESGKEEIKWNV